MQRSNVARAGRSKNGVCVTVICCLSSKLQPCPHCPDSRLQQQATCGLHRSACGAGARPLPTSRCCPGGTFGTCLEAGKDHANCASALQLASPQTTSLLVSSTPKCGACCGSRHTQSHADPPGLHFMRRQHLACLQNVALGSGLHLRLHWAGQTWHQGRFGHLR